MVILYSAYGSISALMLVMGLASTPRPRSVFVIAAAALLWPIAMSAVAAHAAILSLSQRHPAGAADTSDDGVASVCALQDG